MQCRSLGFRVIKSGLLSLIQDRGRFGLQNMGISTGGPIDPLAAAWANRLLGNVNNEALIEVSMGGLQLEAQTDTNIAITGGDMPLYINGQPCELWRSYMVRCGDKIELGYCREACRCYVAVTGGFVIEPQLGSVATVAREGLGGLRGKALQVGDFLPCIEPSSVQPLWRLPENYRPYYSSHKPLRVIPSYQYRDFSREQKRQFYRSEYQLSQQCDRMGYRLLGAKVEAVRRQFLSEGICLGAVQIPADGQPIVLMNDHQSMGGYPKIATVLSLDLAKFGQMLAGAAVRFIPISQYYARLQLKEAQANFYRACEQLQRLD